MTPMGADDELELRQYVDVVLRRKWVVLTSLVLVVVVALGLTLRQTPMYRASTEVLLRSSTSEEILGGSQVNPNAYAQRVNVATEIEYMKSQLIRDAVADALGYEPSVSIRANGETEVVTIAATSTDPDAAAEAANEYARTYIDLRRSQLVDEYDAATNKVALQIADLTAELNALDRRLDRLDERIEEADDRDEERRLRGERDDLAAELAPQRTALLNRLDRARDQLSGLDLAASSIETGGAQLISTAEVPVGPFAPTPLRNGVVAVVVGAILGVGLAFLLETLDERIGSLAELERATGWPAIGVLPEQSTWKNKEETHLVALEDPTSPESEAYRTLRLSLEYLGIDHTLKTILVTSAKPGEGKTTTVGNLAVTLARNGSRVIVIDGDLRRPRLHRFFGLSNQIGLTDIVLGDADVPDTLDGTGDALRLAVIPAGRTSQSPAELLGQAETAALIARLRERCDYLLIDSPPLLSVSDAAVLSRHVDGVVVVTHATMTQESEITRAAELLEKVGAPVVGSVINAAPMHSGRYGYGYRYRDRYFSDYAVTAELGTTAVSPNGSATVVPTPQPPTSADS